MEVTTNIRMPGRGRSTQEERRSCTTDADGTFTISGFGAEPVTLTARIELAGSSEADGDLSRKVAGAVEAAASKLLGGSADAAPSKKFAAPGPHASARAEGVHPGTTGLVLQLIEEGHAPRDLDINEPVETLQEISQDWPSGCTWCWPRCRARSSTT